MNLPTNGFRKHERLKSKKLINQVFSEGVATYNFPFKLKYIPVKNTTYPSKVLISVSKRLYSKAHMRNKIKRKIRESYRLEKSKIISTLKEKNTAIAVVFVYRSKEILSFDEIKEHMHSALDYLDKSIRENYI